MKNTFKKADSKGNQLKEEIGKGLNKKHPLVIKHESYKKEMMAKTKKAVKTLKVAQELIDDWKKIGGSDEEIREFIIDEIIKRTK